MRGSIVECTSYTPPLKTGKRYIVDREVTDPQGKMLMVREIGTANPHGPYWRWRFVEMARVFPSDAEVR